MTDMDAWRALQSLPCPSGKQRHESKAAADAHRKSQRLANNDRNRVYLCDRCGSWHIGRRGNARKR